MFYRAYTVHGCVPLYSVHTCTYGGGVHRVSQTAWLNGPDIYHTIVHEISVRNIHGMHATPIIPILHVEITVLKKFRM